MTCPRCLANAMRRVGTAFVCACGGYISDATMRALADEMNRTTGPQIMHRREHRRRQWFNPPLPYRADPPERL